MGKVDFSYEKFCEYVENKMSAIYERDKEKYGMITDTQSLIMVVPQELGMLSEEKTLRYIYDNKLFDELNEVIVQATTPYKYREAYKKLNPTYDSSTDNIIKKGDYIKTGASDHTLVLKVKDEDAILFTGRQFIVAHGIQKEGDMAYWNWGEYYDELPENVFDNDRVAGESEYEWDLEQ